MKIIGSCLIGVCATWRGGSNIGLDFQQMMERGELLPVCPEQLGGLPTPRPPAEIIGGSGEDVLDGRARVLTQQGVDVTENYLRGAREVLRLAQMIRAEQVILKERSPSCASREIYDGTFSGTLRGGCGVTTALLRRNGFEVVSDVEYLANTQIHNSQ
ncbi:MAG: DUF523 domain-containing protein [Candidatus Sumerlaeaceae bacterium]